jgi:hypothetical protein
MRKGFRMGLFKLGDIVKLKATGRHYDVLGTEDSGRHYYISPRATPVGDGMWVIADEIEIRLRPYTGEW